MEFSAWTYSGWVCTNKVHYYYKPWHGVERTRSCPIPGAISLRYSRAPWGNLRQMLPLFITPEPRKTRIWGQEGPAISSHPMKEGFAAQRAQTEHNFLLKCLFFSSPLTSVWPPSHSKPLPELFFCFTIETSWAKPSPVGVHLLRQSWEWEWPGRERIFISKMSLGDFFSCYLSSHWIEYTELNILTQFFLKKELKQLEIKAWINSVSYSK